MRWGLIGGGLRQEHALLGAAGRPFSTLQLVAMVHAWVHPALLAVLAA
jgi:hypothetical protein